MQIQFTFNEGYGNKRDGTKDFPDLAAAKREAVKALAEALLKNSSADEAIVGSVAGLDKDRTPLFSVRMRVEIEDVRRD